MYARLMEYYMVRIIKLLKSITNLITIELRLFNNFFNGWRAALVQIEAENMMAYPSGRFIHGR